MRDDDQVPYWVVVTYHILKGAAIGALIFAVVFVAISTIRTLAYLASIY